MMKGLQVSRTALTLAPPRYSAESGPVNVAGRSVSLVATSLLMLGVPACMAPPRPGDVSAAIEARDTPRITHGVAAGEVTSASAVVWARCDRESWLHVVLWEAGRGEQIAASTTAPAADDFTGKVTFEGLKAATAYRYHAWCGAADDHTAPTHAAEGVLRTAPAPHARSAVRFAWGGDVAGQNVCRDTAEGYPIFRTIAALDLDFFIGLGDMIYADNPCAATGRYGNPQITGPVEPATDLPGYWAYWKYNREDDALRRLLATTAYYAVWDDHEVLDDFGPYHDTGTTPPYVPGRHLLPLGLKAFLDYNPLRDAPETPARLYRSVRWGQQLEVFFLDTRQYRDANFRADTAEQPKTMLGVEQRTWLKEKLRRSDATWKVIVSSVPMSIPTGSPRGGHDGWANYDQPTGFERELLDILEFMHANGMTRTVWITTDAHCGAVFRYTPFRDDPAFHVHEVVTGPLNAGVFPRREFDTTLGTERLFLYGPASADAIRGPAEAKSWFNFGVIRIDAAGQLAIQIVNGDGTVVYELALPPH
jgi:alkaline phosphatase D